MNGDQLNADWKQALQYAVKNGAKVVNMSFGGAYSAAEETLVNRAFDNGVLLVAAAGNENLEAKRYPCAYESVLCVASINITYSTKSDFSNYGSWVDVSAP